MDPSRGDSRYNINYSMSSIGLSLADQVDMYGNPTSVSALGARPPSTGLIQSIQSGNSGGTSGLGLSPRGLMPNTSQCQTLVSNSTNSVVQQRGIKRSGSDCYDDQQQQQQQQQQQHRSSGGNMSHTLSALDSCGMSAGNNQHGQQQSGNVTDVVDESYVLQHKKSPPANGKKTKGRVKIKMEYIDNKLRRYTTFSKRKTGIMKKAYELSTLTGTQVMLLVASETGHVYTFATRKLQPMITSEAGKQLIQTCLNSPDPPTVGSGDQRMSATGFEETELSYNIADEDSKEDRSPFSTGHESDDSSELESSAQNLPELSESPKSETTSSEAQTLSKPELVMQNNTAATTENGLYSYGDIPQDLILQLIKSGQLQLHSDEGTQYLTLPLLDRLQTPGNDLRLTLTTNQSATNSNVGSSENYQGEHKLSSTLDIKQENI